MKQQRRGTGGNNEHTDNKQARRSVRPIKRSIRIAGHATSVSLENEFWQALRQIAKERNTSLSHLLAEVDRNRAGRSLASACRIHVLQHFQKKAEEYRKMASRAGPRDRKE